MDDADADDSNRSPQSGSGQERVHRTQNPDGDLPLIPGENEIGDRLGALRERRKYGDKIGLESMLETAKLLRLWADNYGSKRGKNYENYADLKANVKKKDAHTLYHLGGIADDVFKYYETESRHNTRFDWPSWRQAARKFMPPEPIGEEEGAEEEDEDQITILTRERDNLAAQVKAVTQQYRSERAHREETEDKLVTERTRREKAEEQAQRPTETPSEYLVWMRPIYDHPQPPPQAEPDHVADESKVYVLDSPMPLGGERKAALIDSGKEYVEFMFGGGKGSRDEHDLRELKTYAVNVLQQHNMDVTNLLAMKRDFWRMHLHDRSLRRLYESAYPQQSR